MKLRNKKTGEILETVRSAMVCKDKFRIYDELTDKYYSYNSLTELNEEWEDYEDELFYIVSAEHKSGYICALKEDYKELCDLAKELGIGFETEEQAKKAVEKLRAWKRLKDKGFDIEGWDNNIGDNYYKTGQIVLNLNNVRNREWNEYDQIMEIKNDLDLLFGGEE